MAHLKNVIHSPKKAYWLRNLTIYGVLIDKLILTDYINLIPNERATCVVRSKRFIFRYIVSPTKLSYQWRLTS